RAGRIGRLKLTVEVQLLEIALELLIEPGKPELYPLNVLWRVNRVLQRVGVEKLAPVQPTPHRLEPRRAPRYQPDLFRLISPFRQLGRHFLKPLPSGGEVSAVSRQTGLLEHIYVIDETAGASRGGQAVDAALPPAC